MSPLDPFRIEAVALDLARTTAAKISFEAPKTEQDTVRELLLAVVSSRVRWEVACAIVCDLLSILYSSSAREPDLHEAVRFAVARHRHPSRIAQWIKMLFVDNGRMLRLALDVLSAQEEPTLARRRLAADVPGLGPKQASLLLRNLGRGQRIAVLDRHILRFMQLLGISTTDIHVSSVRAYERTEGVFLGYADCRRVAADALDLAVWVVMRTATGRNVGEYRDAGVRWAGLDTCGRSSGGGEQNTVSPVH